MRPLRICMLTTFYPPYSFGGDGMGVQRLSRALASCGHQVVVMHDVDAYKALRRGPDPEVAAEQDGVRVERLRSRLGILSPILTHQLGRPLVNGARIRQSLSAGHFDVIHFHNISLLGGPGLLGAGSGVRIYEAHEHWLVCPTHVLWRHNREPCTGRECLRCVWHHRRPPQLWRYTGYLERELRHVDAFIAKSRFSRDKHREFGFPRDMDVVPYFLPDETHAWDTARPQARPYFLFVGRLERIKGLDDVIPLFEDDGEADLLIAGDGEHGAELRRIADGLPRVRFLGRVPPDELARYYRHAVALIVPSRCFETFGIILIEAFRQETPVIARRIGPFPEIVQQCGGGELFSDRRELADAMQRMGRDAAHRRRMGRAARAGFLKYWSETAVIPQYLDVIRRAAQAQGRQDVAAAATASAATWGNDVRA